MPTLVFLCNRRTYRRSGLPANVLEEKGERQQALELVEDALARYEDSVKLRLMKLKLSLQIVPPPQLAQQIDDMIEIMTTKSNQ